MRHRAPGSTVCRRTCLVGALGLMASALLGACRDGQTARETQSAQEVPFSQPDMVQVSGGAFFMGSAEGLPDTRPVHKVNISHALLVAKHCVTFDAFDAFCIATGRGRPDDAGWGRGSRPVINVDWNGAVAYCNWLSEVCDLEPCYSGRGKVTRCDWQANGYRLPSEAEWEWIARGGIHHSGSEWSGSDDPLEVAWHADNAEGSTHAVGQLQPNALGIYDMSGNVWEWCWDKYHKDYYAESTEENPTGPDVGRENKYLGGWERSRRGGDWSEQAGSCTVSYRSFDGQSYKATGSGMRVVRLATS